MVHRNYAIRISGLTVKCTLKVHRNNTSTTGVPGLEMFMRVHGKYLSAMSGKGVYIYCEGR